MNTKYFIILGVIFSLCLLQTACGHKGPPQPPKENVVLPFLNLI